jgi:integrase
LAGKYSAPRVEAAAERALLTSACRYKSVESILRNSLDQVPLSTPTPAAVTPPKLDPREVQAIDETAAAWLIEAAQGTRLYLPILLTTCTGIRRVEILAAVWSNIEEHGGTLRIDRALSETKEAGVILKKTKSKRARTVALPQLLIEALDAHRKEQDKNLKMLGAGYCDADLICCQPDGAVWKPSAFTSAYRALLSRRGIDGPNFHALRHSHASHMLRNGVDYKEVSTRLGHSKASFTITQYANVLPGQDAEAARRTDAAMRKAIEQVRQPKVI